MLWSLFFKRLEMQARMRNKCWHALIGRIIWWERNFYLLSKRCLLSNFPARIVSPADGMGFHSLRRFGFWCIYSPFLCVFYRLLFDSDFFNQNSDSGMERLLKLRRRQLMYPRGGGILCSVSPASPKVLPSFSSKNKSGWFWGSRFSYWLVVRSGFLWNWWCKDSSCCICLLRASGEISIVDWCSPRFETQATKVYVLKMGGSFDLVPGRFPVGVV